MKINDWLFLSDDKKIEFIKIKTGFTFIGNSAITLNDYAVVCAIIDTLPKSLQQKFADNLRFLTNSTGFADLKMYIADVDTLLAAYALTIGD